MRRSTRLALVITLLLLGAIGAYSVFWLIAAGRIEDGVAQWAASLHERNAELSWRSIRVGGFPLAFHLDLGDVRLRGPGPGAGFDLQAPRFGAAAQVWNFRAWRLAAPDGLSATAPFGTTAARLAAPAAVGTVGISGDGSAALWFRLDEPRADLGLPLRAHAVGLWVTLPPRPPQTHTEPMLAIALQVDRLDLPEVPAPLRNPLDEIAFGATVMGAVPAAPPRRAAAAWRDAGGTLELDHLDARWGPLAVSGSGTLALDAELQPIASLSGGVEGYDKLIGALVAAGRVRAGDARIAQMALAMLARPSPDGRPRISTPFTIQNGEMYLGPLRLGPAPRITWP
jgi:hypothetical protein